MIRMLARTSLAFVLLACPGEENEVNPTEPSAMPTGDHTGEPVTDLGPFASGTRLKAATYDGGTEDSRVLRFWVDTELETNCTVARDEAGTERCMPAAAGQFVYADEACTEPLLVWRSCDDSAPPTLLSESLPDRCLGSPSVRALTIGAAVSRDHVYDWWRPVFDH
ncbi:MAG: hypothetical protein AAF211_10645, partial [Myxococcota bacterium]